MILAAGLGGQFACAQDATLRSFEQQLTGVLRWEVLWNDSPVGFQVPSSGLVRLALHSTSSSLSYCSHDVGVCARYRIEPYRNWERDASDRRDGNESDEDAVMAFDGENARKPSGKIALGHGGLTGYPALGSGITWTTTISLGSREEIVRHYKQVHPPEIDELKKWLQAAIVQDAGGASITIACFTPSDPMVYYYVDRPPKGSVVMAVFWNKEKREWIVASSLTRSQSSEKFEEMRRIIESVACSRIRSK